MFRVCWCGELEVCTPVHPEPTRPLTMYARFSKVMLYVCMSPQKSIPDMLDFFQMHNSVHTASMKSNHQTWRMSDLRAMQLYATL